MSDTQFTPGPWMRDGITVTTSQRTDKRRKVVCIAHPDPSIASAASFERMKANASLIASAPDLYRVVDGWLTYLDVQSVGSAIEEERLLTEMRAALARARGQS